MVTKESSPDDVGVYWLGLNKNKRAEYRKALVECLIDGWHHGKMMKESMVLAARHTELTPPGEFGVFRLAERVFGQRVSFNSPVKTALPFVARTINDMLWDGAKTENVRRKFLERLGGNKAARGTLTIAARSLTKKHDWHTVK